jgi:hypothetical protein
VLLNALGVVWVGATSFVLASRRIVVGTTQGSQTFRCEDSFELLHDKSGTGVSIIEQLFTTAIHVIVGAGEVRYIHSFSTFCCCRHSSSLNFFIFFGFFFVGLTTFAPDCG